MMRDFIMRSPPALATKAAVLLLALLLAGCSAIRLGYSNGESVVYWWLNRYVDFDAEQRPWVKRHIEELFAWHRHTQLPDYARLFTQARDRLPHGMTPADAAADYAALKGRMLTVVDRALPALAELALSLQPHQIAHIERKFAANNEDYRKEYLHGSLEERQAHRFRKLMKQAEYWFGHFNAEQEARIRAASDARPLDHEFWLQQRMQRQQALVALLKRIAAEKPNREATVQLLKQYVARHIEHEGTEDGRGDAFLQASRQGMFEVTALIVNLATPEQKVHARDRLARWITDFETLAKAK